MFYLFSYYLFYKWLIVINEICEKKLDFVKLTETRSEISGIWLTVINEIFKFPPRLGPFCQINYLFEIFSGYPS